MTGAKLEMVKKAIQARAKALGVKWDKEKGDGRMKIHKGFLQGPKNGLRFVVAERPRVTSRRSSRPQRAINKQASAYMRDLLVECFTPDYAKFPARSGRIAAPRWSRRHARLSRLTRA